MILGLIIIGLGAALFLYSRLGADPNSVFIEGLSLRLKISYGTSSLICNGLLAILVYFLNRSYINLATVGAVFINGYVADFFLYVFRSLNLNNTFFPLQLLYSLLSLFILSFGIFIYIKQRLGIGAFDAIPEILSDRTGFSFGTTRRAMDIIALTAGILLGGRFGVGTIILSLGTGPMVDFYRRIYSLAGDGEQKI